MLESTLKEAVKEARRFIKKAEAAQEVKLNPDISIYVEYTKESAAVKRASMDLTRILADLRQNR